MSLKRIITQSTYIYSSRRRSARYLLSCYQAIHVRSQKSDANSGKDLRIQLRYCWVLPAYFFRMKTLFLWLAVCVLAVSGVGIQINPPGTYISAISSSTFLRLTNRMWKLSRLKMYLGISIDPGAPVNGSSNAACKSIRLFDSYFYSCDAFR